MKNARLSRIGAERSRRQPASDDSEVERVPAFAVTVTPSRTSKSKSATAKPSTPAPIKAPRQPHDELCIIKRLAGATAEPSIPAKVCNEKACPMRSDGTCCDSKA